MGLARGELGALLTASSCQAQFLRPRYLGFLMTPWTPGDTLLYGLLYLALCSTLTFGGKRQSASPRPP